MARGWESKSIEAQQEEAGRSQRKPQPPLSHGQRLAAERRRSLELAKARAADDLTRATAPAHRRMLEQTLAAIEAQLKTLA